MKQIPYILLLLVLGCASQKGVHTDAEKQAFADLKQMIGNKNFVIVSNRANPLATAALTQLSNTNLLGVGNSATSIDISSNSNAVEIKGDSIVGFLPYFGERRFGGDPSGNHLGIEFADIPENYEVTYDEDKLRAELKFSIDDSYHRQENYSIVVKIFNSRRTDMIVNSSSRSTISYSGNVSEVKKEGKTL